MADIASAEVCDDLLTVLKLDRKPDESAADFTERVVEKARKCPEKQWEALQEPTQEWVNQWLTLEEQAKQEGLEDPELPLLVAEDGETEVEPAEEETEVEAEPPKQEKGKMAKGNGKAAVAAKGKKAAPTKAAPAKKAAAGNGRGRGGPFPVDAKIKILNDSPGFRAGSVRQKVFDNYKSGMTVGEARKAGVPYNHMKWHVEEGWIKIAG